MLQAQKCLHLEMEWGNVESTLVDLHIIGIVPLQYVLHPVYTMYGN